ncbi:superoxide dismutase [Denitrobaculum tricleocarpae]|uniref:Superoxide dismutase n=1 Tax=Denitrobaculum tricleocarpae TaxID=2591009 RepID=A0A545TPY8_9PROT|nr:superoxide dismutase [Denitrobaculum tricleocarpae]TQV79286.1 superoxide dismutase [Denitrobaculum tricleocarpae]
MAFELPPLPYADNALEPHYSANTFSFHHAKHHNAYVVNLNNLIGDSDLAGKSLEDIIMATANDDSKAGVFNNAAQVWNHTFFWNSMSPNGGGRPGGALAAKIDEDFGSFDAFAEKFKASATGRFGSGWTFLVLDGGTLKIVNTLNAGTPMTDGQTALLTIDVWEHAYYLDYQNRRPDYIQTFLDKLANWDFASANFEAA